VTRIRVAAPGLQTTVQDPGRLHWAHYGVSASGAADALALRAANLLAGNAENAPALEMTLIGASLEFESPAVIVLTGSDFGSGLPLWTAVEVKAGEVVRCPATRGGARCYLAVAGGLDVSRVMGSASAHVMTGVGGRALRAGDILTTGQGAIRRPRTTRRAPPAEEGPLRVTRGPQAERFGNELYTGDYTVSEESNRMGLRLVGTFVPSRPAEMLTEGVTLGAIQVPPSGQPIILFVEHQTTGGYPKPANVISADFTRLGQLRPRDRAGFELVTIERALRLLQEQERWIYSLLE
jgi:antagonist of KipI